MSDKIPWAEHQMSEGWVLTLNALRNRMVLIFRSLVYNVHGQSPSTSQMCSFNALLVLTRLHVWYIYRWNIFFLCNFMSVRRHFRVRYYVDQSVASCFSMGGARPPNVPIEKRFTISNLCASERSERAPLKHISFQASKYLSHLHTYTINAAPFY